MLYFCMFIVNSNIIGAKTLIMQVRPRYMGRKYDKGDALMKAKSSLSLKIAGSLLAIMLMGACNNAEDNGNNEAGQTEQQSEEQSEESQ
jgi:hypothetical protein